MRLVHPIKTLSVCLAGLVLFPAVSPAPLTAYIKIDDIQGESQRSGHKDWILITSLDSSGIEAVMADGLPTGKRQHKPLVVTKPIDKATPLLMQALAQGTVFDELTFEVLPAPLPGAGPDYADNEPYMGYKLKDVLVSSIQAQSAGEADSGQATATMTFQYTYAEWHVQQLGPDGTVIDRASAFFDMVLNEAGAISQAPQIEQAAHVEVAAGESFEVDISVKDFDTEFGDLLIDVETDPTKAGAGPVKWMAPESLRIAIDTRSTASGQTTVTLRVSDGENTTSMAFSVFIDSTGTPWDGFLQAYFDADQQLDPIISGPIADYDDDGLANLLEFLFGTNPLEYSPVSTGADGRVRVRFPHLDDDSDGDGIGLEFSERIDDPRIRLAIYGSPDGGTWTDLRKAGSPLYEESTTQGANPLYQENAGTINPPDGTEAYFVRFVAEMN